MEVCGKATHIETGHEIWYVHLLVLCMIRITVVEYHVLQIAIYDTVWIHFIHEVIALEIGYLRHLIFWLTGKAI